MQQNLLEEVETYFTGNTVSQTSVVVGESEEGVRKALGKITPLILSSFIGRAERPGGPETLWTLTHEAAESGVLPNLLTADTLQRRSDLMRALLGEAYGATVARIGNATAIKASSVETLLAIVAQAVLHRLASYAALHDLTPEGLFDFLKSQRNQVLEAMMPGSSAAPLLAEPVLPVGVPAPALSSAEPAATSTGAWAAVGGGHTYSAPVAAAPAPVEPVSTSSGAGRWPWVLALVVLGALAEYFFMRGQFQTKTDETAGSALALAAPTPSNLPEATSAENGAGHYDAALDTYIYDPGRAITLTMLDGSTQTVGVNSTENRLYTFLADPALQVDPVNRTKGWVNFDRVYFDTKKATLTDESKQQLRNVASILKSFPLAHVKIGGYTDTTGNWMANLKLSEERANAAMSELVGMGIAVSRLEAKGYGGKHGIANNDTPVGRSLNRRISIRVTKK